MNDLISVIVPLYNKEHYIEKCIKSILNQDYENLELIVINDGSTDGSLNVCNRFTEDNRLKIITIENHGVHYARNLGIDLSKGKYICFVDADDYIEENHLSSLYNSVIENKSDISLCEFNYCYIDKNKHDIINYEKFQPLLYEANLKTINWIIFIKYYIKPSWVALFNNEIIKKNKIRFNNKFFTGEDLAFLCDYMSIVDNISFTKQRTYNYYIKSLDFKYSSLTKERKKMPLPKYYISIFNLLNKKYFLVDDLYKKMYNSIFLEIAIKYSYEFVLNCYKNYRFRSQNYIDAIECLNSLMNIKIFNDNKRLLRVELKNKIKYLIIHHLLFIMKIRLNFKNNKLLN